MLPLRPMDYVPAPSKKYKKKKFDTFAFGAITGFLCPIVTFTVYYLVLHRYMPIVDYIKYLQGGEIFVATLSLCVISNLLLFFIFIWTNRDKSSKGVVFATILYAAYVAIMKMK